MITQLAGVDHETDWGMESFRIASKNLVAADTTMVGLAAVHRLASVGEYRYHRPQSAYDNLRANVLLALDGSLGHVTEVLSGDYYQRFPLVRRTRSGPRPWC